MLVNATLIRSRLQGAATGATDRRGADLGIPPAGQVCHQCFHHFPISELLGPRDSKHIPITLLCIVR